MSDELALDGMTASEVYRRIRDTGIGEAEAGILVGSWIHEYFGRVRRTFRYRESFPESDESCRGEFSRSFEHADWIDGESVVQAEETPGEQGFNERFHQIESDLDSLGTDVAQAFACINEMRSSLHSLLAEIRSELNRVNGDIYDCCHGGGSFQPMPMPTVPTAPPYGGVIDTGTFLGSTTMGERAVTLWRTTQGFMMLPTLQEIGFDPTEGGRLLNAGAVAKYFEENPEVGRIFRGQGTTKRELIERFGNVTVEDGRTMKELIDVLPPDEQYRSKDALVDALADREAAIIRTTTGSDAAITAVFGVGTDVATVRDAPIERAEAIPQSLRASLSRTEYKTLGALADASTEEIRAALKQQGVDVSPGEVSKWRGVAGTLSRVR